MELVGVSETRETLLVTSSGYRVSLCIKEAVTVLGADEVLPIYAHQSTTCPLDDRPNLRVHNSKA